MRIPTEGRLQNHRLEHPTQVSGLVGMPQISADDQFFVLLQLVTCLVDVGFRHVEPFSEVRGRGSRLLRQNHEDSLFQGERFKRCILRSSLGMGTKG